MFEPDSYYEIRFNDQMVIGRYVGYNNGRRHHIFDIKHPRRSSLHICFEAVADDYYSIIYLPEVSVLMK